MSSVNKKMNKKNTEVNTVQFDNGKPCFNTSVVIDMTRVNLLLKTC